jgi:hypothetical protein
MAFRFSRSLKIAPGIRLNFGKRGIGISAGVRGAHVGVDARGRTYTSAGIPGTGLSVRNYAKAPQHPADAQRSAPGGEWIIQILVAAAFVVALALLFTR